jgi:hypothetical protein
MLKSFDPRTEWKDFIDWWVSQAGNISKITTALEDKLCTSDITTLQQQLKDAEEIFDIATSLLAYAEAFLDYAEFMQIGRAPRDTTAEEKKYWTANAVKNERLFRNLLEGVVKKIETRITVCQTLLKVQR